MKVIYLDTEFLLSQHKDHYHLLCCVTKDSTEDELRMWDLREDVSMFKEYILSLETASTVFACYNAAGAEVPVFCQIFGRTWVLKTHWIDLWSEFKMFALTHSKYYSSKTGLSACLSTLGVEDPYTEKKQEVRSLILYVTVEKPTPESQRIPRISTGNFYYSDEDFKIILRYCSEDVICLSQIMRRLVEISKSCNVTFKDRIRRGAHCRDAGVAEFFGAGFPVDTHRLKKVFDNIPNIKVALQENCNAETGFNIYIANFTGRGSNKVFSHYSFNMKAFSEYVTLKGLYNSWEKTKTGLKLTEDYIDNMLTAYKDILNPIYQARSSIKNLNSTNLYSIASESGYIKPVSWPYNQKTSRSSPKPKLGFLLNLAPWLRMFIQPLAGRAFVSIDYKSQEVLIAACLSKDDAMLEDYMTDIYLGQAIRTGFAPEGATKHTHSELRTAFKPIVLGVGFGMGANSLALRFYDLFKKTQGEKPMNFCLLQAHKFLANHRKVYHKYHSFLTKNFTSCNNRGYYKTEDNWFYFVDSNTRPTQLVNVPCQSTGAAILRRAFGMCVRQGIDVIGLHDSLSFECAEADAERLAKIVSSNMIKASAAILKYDYVETETKIFTEEIPYYDARGEAIYRLVMSKLELSCVETFKKPKEINNIHLL